MIKPLEFLICDETDNSGYSVMPWSEKEAKRQYGSCNVFHVIEKYEIDRLKAENARLREALEFTLKAAEYVYQPDKPVHKGLDPTFYHTLTYEGDMELIEKTKKAREALKGIE